MKWLLLLLGTLVVIMVILFASGDKMPRSAHDALDAQLACREFVKQRMIAPSTAAFSDEDTSNRLSCDTCYEVVGSVAQGAWVSRYLCVVWYRVPTDDWELKTLELW